MPHSQPIEAPATLTVIRYPDPATEAHGYGPEHAYPELTRSKWIFEVSEYCRLGGGLGG